MKVNYYPQKNIKQHLDKISKISQKILPIYWAILTYALLRSGNEGEGIPFIMPHLDKLLHFSVFLILGFLLKTTFPKQKFITHFQIILIYGLFTEILQDEMKLGRTLENLDLLADALGGILGFYIANLTLQKLKRN